MVDYEGYLKHIKADKAAKKAREQAKRDKDKKIRDDAAERRQRNKESQEKYYKKIDSYRRKTSTRRSIISSGGSNSSQSKTIPSTSTDNISEKAANVIRSVAQNDEQTNYNQSNTNVHTSRDDFIQGVKPQRKYTESRNNTSVDSVQNEDKKIESEILPKDVKTIDDSSKIINLDENINETNTTNAAISSGLYVKDIDGNLTPNYDSDENINETGTNFGATSSGLFVKDSDGNLTPNYNSEYISQKDDKKDAEELAKVTSATHKLDKYGKLVPNYDSEFVEQQTKPKPENSDKTYEIKDDQRFYGRGDSFEGGVVRQTAVKDMSLSEITDRFGVSAIGAVNIQNAARDKQFRFDFGTNTGSGINTEFTDEIKQIIKNDKNNKGKAVIKTLEEPILNVSKDINENPLDDLNTFGKNIEENTVTIDNKPSDKDELVEKYDKLYQNNSVENKTQNTNTDITKRIYNNKVAENSLSDDLSVLGNDIQENIVNVVNQLPDKDKIIENLGNIYENTFGKNIEENTVLIDNKTSDKDELVEKYDKLYQNNNVENKTQNTKPDITKRIYNNKVAENSLSDDLSVLGNDIQENIVNVGNQLSDKDKVIEKLDNIYKNTIDKNSIITDVLQPYTGVLNPKTVLTDSANELDKLINKDYTLENQEKIDSLNQKTEYFVPDTASVGKSTTPITPTTLDYSVGQKNYIDYPYDANDPKSIDSVHLSMIPGDYRTPSNIVTLGTKDEYLKNGGTLPDSKDEITPTIYQLSHKQITVHNIDGVDHVVQEFGKKTIDKDLVVKPGQERPIVDFLDFKPNPHVAGSVDYGQATRHFEHGLEEAVLPYLDLGNRGLQHLGVKTNIDYTEQLQNHDRALQDLAVDPLIDMLAEKHTKPNPNHNVGRRFSPEEIPDRDAYIDSLQEKYKVNMSTLERKSMFQVLGNAIILVPEIGIDVLTLGGAIPIKAAAKTAIRLYMKNLDKLKGNSLAKQQKIIEDLIKQETGGETSVDHMVDALVRYKEITKIVNVDEIRQGNLNNYVYRTTVNLNDKQAAELNLSKTADGSYKFIGNDLYPSNKILIDQIEKGNILVYSTELVPKVGKGVESVKIGDSIIQHSPDGKTKVTQPVTDSVKIPDQITFYGDVSDSQIDQFGLTPRSGVNGKTFYELYKPSSQQISEINQLINEGYTAPIYQSLLYDTKEFSKYASTLLEQSNKPVTIKITNLGASKDDVTKLSFGKDIIDANELSLSGVPTVNETEILQALAANGKITITRINNAEQSLKEHLYNITGLSNDYIDKLGLVRVSPGVYTESNSITSLQRGLLFHEIQKGNKNVQIHRTLTEPNGLTVIPDNKYIDNTFITDTTNTVFRRTDNEVIYNDLIPKVIKGGRRSSKSVGVIDVANKEIVEQQKIQKQLLKSITKHGEFDFSDISKLSSLEQKIFTGLVDDGTIRKYTYGVDKTPQGDLQYIIPKTSSIDISKLGLEKISGNVYKTKDSVTSEQLAVINNAVQTKVISVKDPNSGFINKNTELVNQKPDPITSVGLVTQELSNAPIGYTNDLNIDKLLEQLPNVPDKKLDDVITDVQTKIDDTVVQKIVDNNDDLTKVDFFGDGTQIGSREYDFYLANKGHILDDAHMDFDKKSIPKEPTNQKTEIPEQTNDIKTPKSDETNDVINTQKQTDEINDVNVGKDDNNQILQKQNIQSNQQQNANIPNYIQDEIIHGKYYIEPKNIDFPAPKDIFAGILGSEGLSIGVDAVQSNQDRLNEKTEESLSIKQLTNQENDLLLKQSELLKQDEALKQREKVENKQKVKQKTDTILLQTPNTDVIQDQLFKYKQSFFDAFPDAPLVVPVNVPVPPVIPIVIPIVDPLDNIHSPHKELKNTKSKVDQLHRGYVVPDEPFVKFSLDHFVTGKNSADVFRKADLAKKKLTDNAYNDFYNVNPNKPNDTDIGDVFGTNVSNYDGVNKKLKDKKKKTGNAFIDDFENFDFDVNKL